MEKVIYVLWRGAQGDRAGYGTALRGALAQRLIGLGAAGVQVNVCDDEAQGAAPTFHSSRPAMDAFVSVWLATANADRRRPFDDAVAELAGRYAAYPWKRRGACARSCMTSTTRWPRAMPHLNSIGTSAAGAAAPAAPAR